MSSAKLFGLLWHLVAYVLTVESDADILRILQIRLGKMSSACAVASSLQMLDDGLDLLDKKEVDALKRMKKDMSEAEARNNEFKDSYRKKAKDVLPAPSRPRKKAQSAGLRIPDGDISQPEAKLLMPPGCSVWRDRIRGGWCAHPDGMGRCSYLWSQHGGELQALIAMLRHVWRVYLEGNGWAVAQCPVLGLFPGAGGLPGGDMPPGSMPGGSSGPA